MMGEKANAILNLKSAFSKGRGIQVPLDQTLGGTSSERQIFQGELSLEWGKRPNPAEGQH